MKVSVLLTLLAVAGSFSVGQANIIDVAKKANLTTLVAAVEYAGLTTAVTGLAEGTVFAPTNAAFATLLAALNVTSLTAVPKSLVTEVLTYHVLPKTLKAADLEDGQTLEPLGPKGATLTVELNGKSVMIIPSSPLTPATVIKADVAVPGTDVVIHVIDEVLVPEEAL